jgi:hypothetical protein
MCKYHQGLQVKKEAPEKRRLFNQIKIKVKKDKSYSGANQFYDFFLHSVDPFIFKLLPFVFAII